METSCTARERITYLLWYYGLPGYLSREIIEAISRYEEKYHQIPTHVWLRTGVQVNAETVQGLEIGYKDCILRGHFEISAEPEGGTSE